jgi:hypothetical protein
MTDFRQATLATKRLQSSIPTEKGELAERIKTEESPAGEWTPFAKLKLPPQDAPHAREAPPKTILAPASAATVCPQRPNLAVALMHSLFQCRETLSRFEIFLRHIFFEDFRLAKL